MCKDVGGPQQPAGARPAGHMGRPRCSGASRLPRSRGRRRGSPTSGSLTPESAPPCFPNHRQNFAFVNKHLITSFVNLENSSAENHGTKTQPHTYPSPKPGPSPCLRLSRCWGFAAGAGPAWLALSAARAWGPGTGRWSREGCLRCIPPPPLLVRLRGVSLFPPSVGRMAGSWLRSPRYPNTALSGERSCLHSDQNPPPTVCYLVTTCHVGAALVIRVAEPL